MFRKMTLLITLALALAACGTVATPVWNAPEETAPVTGDAGEAASAPTTAPEATTVPPTETPIPPTPTFTAEPPTATAVPPTATTAAASDPITVLVSLSNPDNGKQLFEMFYQEAGFACATCHRVDSEEQLVGPGLLNVGVRGGATGHADHAQTDEAPERYIYNSIVDPSAFVVEGFPDNLMPQVYAELFTEQQIYDIVAYLMTLRG